MNRLDNTPEEFEIAKKWHNDNRMGKATSPTDVFLKGSEIDKNLTIPDVVCCPSCGQEYTNGAPQCCIACNNTIP